MPSGTKKHHVTPSNAANSRRRVATITDVAALAGVSSMTVSRVINGNSNVREMTRGMVEDAIKTLNYVPNRAARSLAGAKQLKIALLYGNPSATYLSDFIIGGLDQASREDIQVLIEKCEIGNSATRVIKKLLMGGIDGIILPPPLCDSRDILDLLIRSGVPTVAVATCCPVKEIAAVFIDDRQAAHKMTRHLINLGHQRIGFITGNINMAAAIERQKGYCAALLEGGLPLDQDIIVNGLYNYRSGLDAAEELFSRLELPTAIFASNDDMAAATIAIAHQRGLEVPSDLTVVGFDDSAIATTIWPELTTIHQPIAEMSRAAVKLLSGMLRARHNRGTYMPHLMLNYKLIRRQSDAAPRLRPISKEQDSR